LEHSVGNEEGFCIKDVGSVNRMADALVFGFEVGANVNWKWVVTLYTYSTSEPVTMLAQDSPIKANTLLRERGLYVLVKSRHFTIWSSNPPVSMDDVWTGGAKHLVYHNEKVEGWKAVCDQIIEWYREGYVMQVPQPGGLARNEVVLVKRKELDLAATLVRTHEMLDIGDDSD
jgi:hypothetical protein